VQIVNQYNNFKEGPGTAMTIVALIIVVVAALTVAGLARLARRGGGRARVYRGL